MAKENATKKVATTKKTTTKNPAAKRTTEKKTTKEKTNGKTKDFLKENFYWSGEKTKKLCSTKKGSLKSVICCDVCHNTPNDDNLCAYKETCIWYKKLFKETPIYDYVKHWDT